MFAEERRNKIIQLIKSGHPVKVVSLSILFSVSEATIRRDLQELENIGLLQRTHGGAVSPQLDSELSFHDREVFLLDEKRQIALAAANLVQDGETILLDAGTTSREIARALCGKRLTIATNSMDVACIFAEEPDIEVLLLGGAWRKSINSLVGPLTNAMLKLFCFDKAFVAANAVDCMLGASTHNLAEAETKGLMLQSARQSILVVDHSKFEQKTFCKICNLNELSMIITDSGTPKDTLDCLRTHTQVLVAE
ncbi:DeoR/GlpR family DNA-binding transcription regulator [Pelosinus sp. sgz500959]|uniref:DeoR/GlpR family DNA-binding transcription regulator n=1 Tax=Pelosinus sp. sgz500959 TaxID=3242472 RepID=UPI00367199E8